MLAKSSDIMLAKPKNYRWVGDWNCTIDSYTRGFYFKCTHNILFLNKMLFKWKMVASPLCSFCKQEDENISHLFSKCSYLIPVNLYIIYI